MLARLAKLVPVAITVGTAVYELSKPDYITTSKDRPKSIAGALDEIEQQGRKYKWVKEAKISEMLEEGWEFFERRKYKVKRERFRHPNGAVLMITKAKN